MGLLDDLGARLDAAAIGITTGTNLLLGVLPPGDGDSGALLEYEGDGVLRRQTETPTTLCEQPRVQMIWRASDYATGMAQARAAWKALECANTTLGTTFYQRVQADNSPFHMGRDAQDRWLFAVNFTITREAA